MSAIATAPSADAAPAEAERHLVVFTLHGERYALPITAVREIIRYTKPQASAAASGAIQGMILLRGNLLPVVDLSTLLGQTTDINEATKILVTEVGARALGLIVDSVDEVMLVPSDQIEQIPVSGQALGHEIAKFDERLVTLLDPERAVGYVLAD